MGKRRDASNMSKEMPKKTSKSILCLSSVDVYLSMDEIYKRVNFDEPLMEE